MSDYAIKVTKLSKSFKLPHEKRTSVKSAFVGLFKHTSYEKQRVLKDISFSVKKGEFFGIVGRNGSGKSTLLKLLAGVYTPNSGKIEIAGRLTPFIELGVGFNPELTGRENVYLNGALLGFSTAEMDAQYDDIVSFAELEDFMDQKLKNYSSGMQVRLAFSIATRADAPILLLDEVLAVGDIAFQRKCYNYFKNLKRENKTVILVTHDMDVVREFCDKGILLNSGEIIFSGSAQEIAREYARLFAGKTDDEGKENESSDKTRWGDKTVTFSSVTLNKKDESFVLDVSAIANENVESPVFGFVVQTADGRPILGTNSHIKGLKSTSLKAGQNVNFVWQFSDVFANGDHRVDVAITERDGATVHDWWENAAKFTVSDKDKTPYIISPDITVKEK